MNNALRRGHEKQGGRRRTPVWAVPTYAFLNLAPKLDEKLAYYNAVSISREWENSRAIIIIRCLPGSILGD